MAELEREERIEIKLDVLLWQLAGEHGTETAKARIARRLSEQEALPGAAADATELNVEDWRRIEAGLFMASNSVRYMDAEKAYESTLEKVRRFREFLTDQGENDG